MPVAVVAGPGLGVHERTLLELCRREGADLRFGSAEVPAPPAVVLAGTLEPGAWLERAGLVWLDLEAAVRPRDPRLDPARVCSIRGRGLEGLHWACRAAAARASWPFETIRYGDDVEHVADLRLPAGKGRFPVCALVHGGGWRERWERDLMDGLALDLTRRGYATWNLEFRRVGPSGGGYPTMLEDVAAAVAHLRELADERPLDLDRLVLVGHSAGGHLALWAGARGALEPSLVVSLAGVPDLRESGRRGTDEGSTITLMGGLPDEVPGRYADASPAELLPLGVPQLLVVGTADRPDLVDCNRGYAPRAAAAGDEVEFLELPGADHFDVIDPDSLAWLAVVERLEAGSVSIGAAAPEATARTARKASTPPGRPRAPRRP